MRISSRDGRLRNSRIGQGTNPGTLALLRVMESKGAEGVVRDGRKRTPKEPGPEGETPWITPLDDRTSRRHDVRMNANPKSAIPLYFQIEQDLASSIASGALAPGSQLPSEEELVRKYGVSRTTVRKAIQELERLELIEIRRGKGTFVREAKLTQELTALTGFVEDMVAIGLQPSARVLGTWTVPADRGGRPAAPAADRHGGHADQAGQDGRRRRDLAGRDVPAARPRAEGRGERPGGLPHLLPAGGEVRHAAPGGRLPDRGGLGRPVRRRGAGGRGRGPRSSSSSGSRTRSTRARWITRSCSTGATS